MRCADITAKALPGSHDNWALERISPALTGKVCVLSFGRLRALALSAQQEEPPTKGEPELGRHEWFGAWDATTLL